MLAAPDIGEICGRLITTNDSRAVGDGRLDLEDRCRCSCTSAGRN